MYIEKLITDTEALKTKLECETMLNINNFQEEIEKQHEDTQSGVLINLCTIVSEHYGCHISHELLNLLEVEHEEEEAVDIVDYIELKLNNELEELIKDVPRIITLEGITYIILFFFGFNDDNGYCLNQYIEIE